MKQVDPAMNVIIVTLTLKIRRRAPIKFLGGDVH